MTTRTRNQNGDDEQNGEQEPASVNELLAELEELLSKRGVKFGEKTEPADVLQAAIDYIDESAATVAASYRLRGRTYGKSRDTVIATARAEHAQEGAIMVAGLTDYIDGALKESGFVALNEAETEQIVLNTPTPDRHKLGYMV